MIAFAYYLYILKVLVLHHDTITLHILILLLNAVLAFTEMAPKLLASPGVKFLLSERYCQGPLESFFGKQRVIGKYQQHSLLDALHPWVSSCICIKSHTKSTITITW